MGTRTRWDLWLWEVLRCAEGPADYTAAPNVKCGVRHDFFLENQRLVQRVKACQNMSKHVMVLSWCNFNDRTQKVAFQHIPTLWQQNENSSMNPQWCCALVRLCSEENGLKLQ